MDDPLLAAAVGVLGSLLLLVVFYFPLLRDVDQLRRELAVLRGDEPTPPVSVFTGRLGLLHRLIHRGHHRTDVPVPSPTSPRSPA